MKINGDCSTDRNQSIERSVVRLIIAVWLQVTDKAVFLMREYVKYSLYDRISTRPFLTMIEKKFIAFQILFALRQCHTLGVSV